MITYVNDKFEKKDGTVILLSEADYYAKNKVKVPTLGNAYTIREVVIVSGNYTLLLNEIVNKKVKIGDGDMREPSWHYSRFSDCGPHGVLDWETVHQIYNDQQLKAVGRESGLFP